MAYDYVDITDMQCWLFRMAQQKWGVTAAECADIFKEYDVMGFIDECYDTLHLEGYRAALDDVESMLKKCGKVVA